jgi:hypothetical protein
MHQHWKVTILRSLDEQVHFSQAALLVRSPALDLAAAFVLFSWGQAVAELTLSTREVTVSSKK